LRLTPQWRAKLHGSLPYVLNGLQQERGDDVDVIVLRKRDLALCGQGLGRESELA